MGVNVYFLFLILLLDKIMLVHCCGYKVKNKKIKNND